MKQIKTLIAVAALAAVSLANVARAHFDVRPYVAGGKIVTGAQDDATGETFPVVRAYGYDFGEDAGNPYFIGDPGFNAAAGSGLTAGSTLRFDVLSSLRYWDGTGDAPSFAAPTAAESIALSFGPANSTTVSGASGAQPGFVLATVGANGSVHRHMTSTLNAGTSPTPAEGVYAVLIDLANSDASIGRSDAFYLVFNNGLSETQHDAAMASLEASLVPEPATLAALAGAGLLALRRRR